MKQRVLLVTETEDVLSPLREICIAAGGEPVAGALLNDNWQRLISAAAVDLLLLAVSRLDGVMPDLLRRLPTPVPVLALSEDAHPPHLAEAVEAGMNACLSLRTDSAQLAQGMLLAEAQFARMHGLVAELDRVRDQLAERKLIEQAKGILMDQKGMSEAQAYQMLRRTAMNTNRQMADIARGLISATKMLSA